MDITEQAVSDLGTQLERDQALTDARDIIRERGAAVTIRLHTEQNVTRDKFNTIEKRDISSVPGITFYAFPIIYTPTDKQLESWGIREKTQVLIKTAVQDWIDAGYTMATLKDIGSIRTTVIINGAKYEIRDKQLDSQYQDVFLYVHLGLNRI